MLKKLLWSFIALLTILILPPQISAQQTRDTRKCEIKRIEPSTTVKQGEEFTLRVFIDTPRYVAGTGRIKIDELYTNVKTDTGVFLTNPNARTIVRVPYTDREFNITVLGDKTAQLNPQQYTLTVNARMKEIRPRANILLGEFGEAENTADATCTTTFTIEKNDSIPQQINDPNSGVISVLKPLKLRQGTTDGLEPYHDVNFSDPKHINEGDTRVIDAYFLNIPTSNNRNPKTYKSYYLCFQTEEANCFKGEAMNRVDPGPDTTELSTPNDSPLYESLSDPKPDSLIKVRVCGNGKTSLKAWKDCDKPSEVWFHGGNTYFIRLYDKDKSTKIWEIPFYVHRFYPNVFIQASQKPNTPPKLVASADQKLQEEFTKPQGLPIVFTPDENRPIIEITLTGKKWALDTNNNYQVNLQNLGGSYNKTTCTTILPSEKIDSTAPNSKKISFGSLGTPLTTGRYVMRINEQINDDHTLGINNSDCDGGFTYWVITLDIAKTKDNKYETKIINVVQDPNGQDDIASKTGDEVLYGPGRLPCAKGEGIDIGTCETVTLPLIGTVPTKPELFITRLFQVGLQLAGIILVFIFLINGYRFLISQGDKQKIADARERITAAVLGLLFIVLSFVILELIIRDVLRIPGF